MSASASPAPHAQTLRQAKAAYKARTQAQLSDKERKQLERSLELDRRAWRLKEAEKRKTEAAKKRAEKEKEERENIRLGSQRRCDKFGYKSSQMHLGAFLGRPKMVEAVVQRENTYLEAKEVDEEEFEDSEVDDETLLDALECTPVKQSHIPHTKPTETAARSLNPTVVTPSTTTEEALDLESDDFSFDDFCSSTQIARDLEPEPALPTAQISAAPAADSRTDDDFDDFEMTADDLVELDTTTTTKKASQDRRLMPPPPPPVQQSTPPKLVDVGFTVCELEGFVEDDLQLTQVDPV